MRILLVNYDNDSQLPQPPHALAYLAAACRNAGHQVSVWDAGVTHAPPADLAATVDALRPDVVGIGVIGGWWQYRQLVALTAALRTARHPHRLILGGHGPAPDPAYFTRLTGADTVFVGEADLSLPKWLSSGMPSGVVPSVQADVDSLPRPAWDLLDMSVYRRTPYPRKNPAAFSATVLSGRGCVHSCNFCYRMEKGYRPRKPAGVAAEIDWLKHDYGISYVNMDDELMFASQKRARDMCEAIGPCGVSWMANARLDVVTPEVLRAAREAGCVFLNYGVECLDDAVLAGMNKRLTVKQITRGIEATLEAGISPGINVMWGAPFDSLATLGATVEFLLKYDDGAQVRTIRPMTCYPGSEFFNVAVREGRLSGAEDFYRKHVNSDLATVQWTGLSDADFHAALLGANTRLLENHHAKQCARQVEDMRQLYSGECTEWRGTRQT